MKYLRVSAEVPNTASYDDEGDAARPVQRKLGSIDNLQDSGRRNKIRTFLNPPQSTGNEVIPQARAVKKANRHIPRLARLNHLARFDLNLADIECAPLRRSKVVIRSPTNCSVGTAPALEIRAQSKGSANIYTWTSIREKEVIKAKDLHLEPNVQVERHVAALSRPELIYPDSSILLDLQRSYAACPLQRKLGASDTISKRVTTIRTESRGRRDNMTIRTFTFLEQLRCVNPRI
jgi:hypothetical protein